MAYSNFTLSELRRKFGLQQKVSRLFETVELNLPSNHLKIDIEEGLQMPLTTEKAKSELIIAPIFKEIKRKNPQFSFFSGYSFDVDVEKQLVGRCDYILTAKTDIVELEAPVFCLVEAKNGVIEYGYGQCAAEMLAACIYNKNDGKDIEVIYGVVTNGFDWVFMKLEKSTIYIDNQRYFLNNLPLLLGVLQTIVKKYTPLHQV